MIPGETDLLQNLPFAELVDRVAARSPTPGGGAVAALVAALAGALAQMVANFSIGRDDLAAHEASLQADIQGLTRTRALLLELGAEDMAAYELVSRAMRLPKDDPTRPEQLAIAATVATRIPQALIATCCDLLRLFQDMAPRSNRSLRSDLAIAAILAEAAARASLWNITINLPLYPDATAGRKVLEETSRMLAGAGDLLREVESACG